MTKREFVNDVLSQVGRNATVTVYVREAGHWWQKSLAIVLLSSTRSFRTPASRSGRTSEKCIDMARTRQTAEKKAERYLRWAQEAAKA